MLMNLSCLRELRLPNGSRYVMPIAGIHGIEKQIISPLQLLEIDTGILLNIFQGLLLLIPSLKSLECRVPVTSGPRKNPTMIRRLSPAQITVAFAPAETSLVDLRLRSNNQHWLTHDSSRLDLSSFNRLRALDVPYFL